MLISFYFVNLAAASSWLRRSWSPNYSVLVPSGSRPTPNYSTFGFFLLVKILNFLITLHFLDYPHYVKLYLASLTFSPFSI
jgi:hypothetical protein